MKAQLLVFDWDGTLMDSGEKIIRCFQAAAKDSAMPPPADEAIKRLVGIGLVDAWRVLFADIDDETAQLLTDNYRRYWLSDKTPTLLFDGVQAGLRELEEDGYLLAVATGKSRVGLDRSLEETGLAPHFRATRCADESQAKPSPKMLHEVLTLTGVRARHAIMIGDTTFDMQMAKRAGVPSLGVSYGSHEIPELEAMSTFPVQHSFTDLVEWLRAQK